MADRISGYPKGAPDIRPVRSGNASGTGSPVGPAARGSARQHAAATEPLRLTDTARVLRNAEARLAGLPDIDAARVEALRQQVDAGTYTVDANRVARQLLGLERDMG